MKLVKELSKMDRLEIKLMRIISDYKYNSTQTETCQMVAQRIINLMLNSRVQK